MNKFEYKKFSVLLLILFSVSSQIKASKKYWISANTANWYSTANWSTTSGGAGGTSVPGTSDTAYFDGNGLGRCNIDINISVRRFEITSSYTDSIIQNAYTVTVGGGHMILDGGVFIGSSYAITINGNYDNSACNFTSTSGMLEVNADFKLTGTGSFIHNNGSLKLSYSSLFPTNTLTCSTSSSNKELYVLILDMYNTSAKTLNITSGNVFTVNSTLTISGAGRIQLNTGTIEAKGNIDVTNTYNASPGGSGLLKINGSGTQTLESYVSAGKGTLPHIEIAKSSGDTLKLAGIISMNTSNWTYTSGIVDAGTSTLHLVFGPSQTISGSHTLNKLSLYSTTSYACTISSGTTITVEDTLKTSGTGVISILTGTLVAQGNIVIENTSTSFNIGDATILINGGGSQHFTGASAVGKGVLPNVIINKTGGTLSLSNYINILKDWTYTAGTIDPGTSTVSFYGTDTITGSHALYNVNMCAQTATTYHTISSGTTLTVNGTYSSLGAYAMGLYDGILEAKGDVVAANTYNGGGGDATILINGTGNQTLTGSGIAAYGRLPNITINKSAGTLYLSSIISVQANWEYIAGTVDAFTNTSKVYFAGTYNLDPQGTSATMSFYDLTIGSNTRTLTGDLKVSNNLTINSSTTLAQGTYGLSFGGYTNNGTHTGSGATTLIGDGYHTFSKSGGGSTSFANVTTDRTGGSLALSSPMNITTALTMNKGVVKTTSTNLLTFADNATTSGGSDSAYVHGPIKKTGNDAFVFPLGDTAVAGSGKYHPLSVSAPSSATDAYTATYYAGNQTQGSTIDTLELDSLSNCEYWNLTQTTGSSSVYVGLGWSSSSCKITADSSDMRLARWDGTKWIKEGSGYTASSVRSTAALSSFGYFTLAQNACYAYKNIALNISAPTGVCIGRSVLLNSVLSATTYTPSYSWSSGPTTEDITVSPTVNTSYTVTATYPHGCTKTASTSLLAYNDNHYLDTDGFDTIVAPDTVLYRIVVDGVNDTVRAYNDQNYCVNLPISGYLPVDIYFASKAFTDTLHIQYDLDSVGVISGLRIVSSGNLKAVDPDLFEITSLTHLRIVPRIIIEERLTASYYKLKKELDGGFYLAKNKRINFLYEEEYNTGDLTYRVLNSKREPLSGLATKTRKYGTNQYSVAFPNSTPLGIYYLEVTNAKGENFYLRFKLM
ncbi:MAG: hypothetical protein Q8M29_01225 [Bacteroidota bacterium]|nr:hypothetical protein [Bacteroidota bacterium]